MTRKDVIMKTSAVLILIIIANLAWAGTSRKIKPEHIADVRKIAIVTNLYSEDLRLIDINGLKNKNYGGGALGGLVSGLARNNLYSSLGGDFDSLATLVEGLPIMQIFNEHFCSGLDIGFEIMTSVQVAELGMEFPAFFRGKGIVPNNARKDYRVLRDSANVDLVLEIKFIHGLAAYGGGVRPTAAISSDYILVETKNNKMLVMNDLTSDSFYRESHSVEEFIAGGKEMYEKEIIAAINGLKHLFASEFGRELPLKEGSFWNTKGE